MTFLASMSFQEREMFIRWKEQGDTLISSAETREIFIRRRRDVSREFAVVVVSSVIISALSINAEYCTSKSKSQPSTTLIQSRVHTLTPPQHIPPIFTLAYSCYRREFTKKRFS